ncbi:MAG: hypothetical protein K8U03_17640 [Planctomycetia bacterium]|nr:hypothetical protein [Planctomycetia bacterium]
MPQLHPLIVPWSISPSTPSLGFASRNIDGVNHGYVTFVGFLGETTKLCSQHGRYKQIAVVLEQVQFAKLYPENSASDSARIDGYDWSLVPNFADENNALKGATRRFQDQWNATDLCPQPSAFTVHDSELLSDLRVPVDKFKHYLFVGDDFNVEVVAKSMTWQVVEAPAEAASSS